jgi:hypothetical protein
VRKPLSHRVVDVILVRHCCHSVFRGQGRDQLMRNEI